MKKQMTNYQISVTIFCYNNQEENNNTKNHNFTPYLYIIPINNYYGK